MLREDERDAAGRFDRFQREGAKQQKWREAFKEAQAWSEAQLQQWATLAAEREDDSLALQLYHRQDEAVIKQLTSELQRCPQTLSLHQQRWSLSLTEAATREMRGRVSSQVARVAGEVEDARAVAQSEEAGLAAAAQALERCKVERQKLAELHTQAVHQLQKCAVSLLMFTCAGSAHHQ